MSQEKKIEDTRREEQRAIDGAAPDKATLEKTLDEMSLSELTLKLRDLVFERGKAWFGCKPGNISVDGKVVAPEQLGGGNPSTPENRLKLANLVEVRLSVTGPIIERDGKEEIVPPDEMKGIVYLVDEGREGGAGASFLGRFTVTQVRGAQVTLTAADIMNENEIQRIQRAARSTWAVYTIMPRDRFVGVFDQLSPDEIDTIIPAAKRAELTNPDRPLQDFEELLNRLYDWRVELQTRIDRSKKDLRRLEETREMAAAEIQSLQKDGDLWKKRIAAMRHQVEILQKRGDEYDATIRDMEEKIETTQKQNEWYVAKIAEYQLKVAELIRNRAETAAME